MKKLTAEKCCQLLDTLNSNGMSILEGYYAEALEIALPILEQHKVDSEALAVSREIMKIMYGPMPKGGSAQLMAQVQCLVIDAMKVAQGDNSLSRQQERGEGEWIEWSGGECPPVTGRVQMKWADGSLITGSAGDWRWSHEGVFSNIIAYRIIPERATNQNGEQ